MRKRIQRKSIAERIRLGKLAINNAPISELALPRMDSTILGIMYNAHIIPNKKRNNIAPFLILRNRDV